MALQGANLELIPIYLESESKDELIRLMALNNQVNRTKFNYMSPMLEGKNWLVWFYADIKYWHDPREISETELALFEGAK